MFEGNTISFKDNNVTLLSKNLAILYLASSTISLKQILVLSKMHLIHLEERLHSPKRTLSQLPFVFESNTFFRKRITPFKETQPPSIWKGTPVTGRTLFTHKFAHPQRLHPLKEKMHIPKEYCALLSYTHFLSMVCKGYI
jgi:hypothetical protein